MSEKMKKIAINCHANLNFGEGEVKIKSTLKVGSKVNIVQKTKKTPGVITKIMRSKCLVKCSITTYRVPMSMLEAA